MKKEKDSLHEVTKDTVKNSERLANLFTRTAKEVRRYQVTKRILASLLSILITIVTITYVISMIFYRSGSFTVKVDKFDMQEYGLSLSESKERYQPTSNLNADIDKSMTNISGSSIPKDVDVDDGSKDGAHNGKEYIAYTFYVKNVGAKDISYNYIVSITSVTNDLDEAIRIKLYHNGESEVYAKTKSNGEGPEPNTEPFYSLNKVTEKRVDDFKVGDTDRFTIVIWIEGDDPDCIDWLIGGKLKVDMRMEIVH